MNNNHYPILELCKKLKEIGFPETEGVYLKYKDTGRFKILRGQVFKDTINEKYPCPSIMEMLDVMPVNIFIEGIESELRIHKNINGNYCYEYKGYDGWIYKQTWGTNPNALAEMIIWLVENKLLTLNK